MLHQQTSAKIITLGTKTGHDDHAQIQTLGVQCIISFNHVGWSHDLGICQSYFVSPEQM